MLQPTMLPSTASSSSTSLAYSTHVRSIITEHCTRSLSHKYAGPSSAVAAVVRHRQPAHQLRRYTHIRSLDKEEEERSTGPDTRSNDELEDDDSDEQPRGEYVDLRLSKLWENYKANMKKHDPEAATVIESIKYEDIMDKGPSFIMQKLADEQLGPLLSSVGLDKDPYEFLVDLIQTGMLLQLITCGTLFYACELGLHMDTGEALRCTSGLALGYATRPLFTTEHLVWPLYEAVVNLLGEAAPIEIAPATREQVQTALNRLGVALASAFLIPQLLFGWDTHESVQLVAPLAAGWVMFDVCYIASLMINLGPPPNNRR